MAVKIKLVNTPGATAHRIAPVRFARAVTDVFSDKEAPDVDDRGYIIADAFGESRGPVVGIAQGKTVRIRVVRDRLDKTAALHATVLNSAVASIEFPLAGTALNADDIPAAADGSTPLRQADCVLLKATGTGPIDQLTPLRIHFGSAGGPILAEMSIRVYPPLTIPVQAHLVAINGQMPTTDMTAVSAMFDRVNHIYAQAGVEFQLNPLAMAESVTGFARAGTVTLSNVADRRNRELQTVLNQNPRPGTLNAYFFGHFFDTVINAQDQTLGIAFSGITAAANPPAGGFPGTQAGITVRDSTDPIEAAHTVAHEIGHALTLEHYGRGNPPNRREDIWAHRALMHNLVDLSDVDNPPPFNAFHNSPARTIVGYGTYADGRTCAGQLLGTKLIGGIPQSDQVNQLRLGVIASTFAPVRV